MIELGIGGNNMNKATLIIGLLFLSLAVNADTFNFNIKELKDFKRLSAFKSEKDFENYINKYIQECNDNWGGSAAGAQCFVGYEIWDRELNVYYKKLAKLLDKKGKKALKTSQKAWLKSRDSSRSFISLQLDKIYTEQGTMYIALRAEDGDSAITPMVKQRALTFKNWVKLIQGSKAQ